MLRNIHIGACTLLAIALGCTESYKPDVSTETGNPPVTIDSAKIALVVTRDEVHVQGKPGAVMPPEADVEITIVRTEDVTRTGVEADGSFDAEVDATLNDVFEVRAVLGDDESDVVIVVRGGAEVIEGDGGGLSCEQQTSLGAAILDGAYETADRSCEVAADCSEVFRGASCVTGCFVGYYSDEGQRAIGDAIETIDDGVCASFEEDGCMLDIPPCIPPLPAACIDGQCVADTGGECDTCLATEIGWRVTGAGVLPALPSNDLFALDGCNELSRVNDEGSCMVAVPQCAATAGDASIEALNALLATPEVMDALAEGGAVGEPTETAGYSYEITVNGQTFTYRSCADLDRASCLPPNPLEQLTDLLARFAQENTCTIGPDPEADCTSDFEVGDCDAAISRWWHDPKTGACLLRTYGGCGGNQNNYASEEACRTACPPPASAGDCPPNRVFAEDVCFDCGPVGPCLEPTNACLLVCSEDAHCEGEEQSMNIEATCSDSGVCGPEIICL